ncbi:MAG: MATE family efflux transporter [Clostridiales bacterium]|nr:MATE family efflux transporter [Clostridiales bacterium]MCI7704337.1 MATE family efflux transporter [Clostridiales bacterium]MDY3764675.1 MATE family efflux transporter [Candidatus Ventricola sp.]MDY4543520.1 MATE family efflux transporter [Candidatus Ventricola sp.]
MRRLIRQRPDVNGITEGVIWKQLLLFFFPIVLGTFFQQLYNTADAIIVGKAVGKEALAAVGGSTGTLINLLVGFFVGLASGASVIIAQLFGARRAQDVSRAVHTTIALALSSGALLTAVGLLCAGGILELMGTPQEVMAYALPYLNIYFLGMIPQLVYNIGSGVLRAVGDSRRPMLFLICAALTNIVLDILLVLGLNLGVRGAAIATVLSQVVSAVLILVSLCHAQPVYRLHFRRIRFHGDMLARIVRIGLPAGLQSVMYSLSNMIIQASVNGFGTDVMAAWTAYGKIDGLYWMMISAFGVSITTFAGQNFGARRYDRMRRSVRVCLGMAAGVTVFMTALILAVGRPMLGMFTDDAHVVEMGMSIIRLIVPTWITYLCIEILSGAMRGAGDSLMPTLMTLTGVCLMRVFWVTVVVPRMHQLPVLMLSYPITWVITSCMFIVYYLRGRWLDRCIARQGSVQKP